MQNFMNDTPKFVEMIHRWWSDLKIKRCFKIEDDYSVKWEDGLEVDVMEEVESYLMKRSDDDEGITGEGSLLSKKSMPKPKQQQGDC